MDDDRRSTEQETRAAFTAILCDDCANSDDLPVLDVLRNTVRSCPHGVLVRSRCQLGQLWCHLRKTAGAARGAVVLVQPCDTDRRPLGTLLPVGPIRTADDLAAVARWLATAPNTTDGLPAHLCGALPNPQHASRN